VAHEKTQKFILKLLDVFSGGLKYLIGIRASLTNNLSGKLVSNKFLIFNSKGQGCGSGSELDPDSIGSVDPDPRGQK
jgi:hypothetical protein